MLRGYKEGNRFKVLSTSVNEYIAGRMNWFFRCSFLLHHLPLL
jgi:hypothetical protein